MREQRSHRRTLSTKSDGARNAKRRVWVVHVNMGKIANCGVTHIVAGSSTIVDDSRESRYVGGWGIHVFAIRPPAKCFPGASIRCFSFITASKKS